MQEQQKTASADEQVKKKPHIKIQEQGPYVVSGNPRLTRRIRVLNSEGEPIAWEEGDDWVAPEGEYKLCRCGHSENKPFCDDHHLSVDWDGTLSADKGESEPRRKVFPGKEIVMTDDESLCAGYAFCDLNGSVWEEIKHTEDPQLREALERQILRCPSGRLQWKHNRNEAPVEDTYEPTIATTHNGALWILGGIQVEGPDGTKYEVRNRQLLCRCGLSKNKPFCDGTHWDTHFKAP